MRAGRQEGKNQKFAAAGVARGRPAAEVRFSRRLFLKLDDFGQSRVQEAAEKVPIPGEMPGKTSSGAKAPLILLRFFGTAEAVPFQNNSKFDVFRSLSIPRSQRWTRPRWRAVTTAWVRSLTLRRMRMTLTWHLTVDSVMPRSVAISLLLLP